MLTAVTTEAASALATAMRQEKEINASKLEKKRGVEQSLFADAYSISFRKLLQSPLSKTYYNE